MKYEVMVKFRKDFVEVTRNTIIIGIRSRPEKDKANDELMRKIADYFNVPLRGVKIISGAKSKKKIVEIL